MSASVCRRLINWARHVADQASQNLVQILRCTEIHSDARRHINDRRVVGINDGGSERQVHNAIVTSGFGYHVDVVNRDVGVSQLPPLTSYGDFPPGFDHNFVLRHQSSPLNGFDALAACARKESSEVAA